MPQRRAAPGCRTPPPAARCSPSQRVAAHRSALRHAEARGSHVLCLIKNALRPLDCIASRRAIGLNARRCGGLVRVVVGHHIAVCGARRDIVNRGGFVTPRLAQRRGTLQPALPAVSSVIQRRLATPDGGARVRVSVHDRVELGEESIPHVNRGVDGSLCLLLFRDDAVEARDERVLFAHGVRAAYCRSG